MKTPLLLLVLLLCNLPVFSQYRCRTQEQPDGSSVKTCYHQNGKLSTSETWQKDKRSGIVKGFDKQGKELFSHYLRNYGGHASVEVTYFSNGQVKTVHYSDAPDGGIQYYRSTTQYDENGNQTAFYEDKYPNELTLPFRMHDSIAPRKPVVEVNRVLEPTPKTRVDLRIVNKTRSAQRIAFDYTIGGNDTLVKIGGKQELNQSLFLDKEAWKGSYIPQLTLSGRTRQVELIRGKDEEVDGKLVVTWYIIRK